MALEQVMRRVKAALVSDLAANLNKWDAPSVPATMPALTLDDVPEDRIYLYGIPETAIEGFPCIVLTVPASQSTRYAAPTSRARNAEHTIEATVFVLDTHLETAWARCLRLGRAVTDTLLTHDYGTATTNSGIPFDTNVQSEEYGRLQTDEDNGMCMAAILSFTVRERVSASYTSI